MKKVFVFVAILFIGLSATAQEKNLKSFFNSLEDGDDYAVISVNKEMFKMLASFDIELEDGVDIKEIIKDINKLKIYAHDEGADYEQFKKIKGIAESSDMAQLLSIKDGAERVYLYTNDSNGSNIVQDLLLLVRNEGSNVFIWLDGKVDLKQVSKIAKTFDIDNLNHLEKLDRM